MQFPEHEIEAAADRLVDQADGVSGWFRRLLGLGVVTFTLNVGT